jgi:hypothetical protein
MHSNIQSEETEKSADSLLRFTANILSHTLHVDFQLSVTWFCALSLTYLMCEFLKSWSPVNVSCFCISTMYCFMPECCLMPNFHTVSVLCATSCLLKQKTKLLSCRQRSIELNFSGKVWDQDMVWPQRVYALLLLFWQTDKMGLFKCCLLFWQFGQRRFALQIYLILWPRLKFGTNLLSDISLPYKIHIFQYLSHRKCEV